MYLSPFFRGSSRDGRDAADDGDLVERAVLRPATREKSGTKCGSASTASPPANVTATSGDAYVKAGTDYTMASGTSLAAGDDIYAEAGNNVALGLLDATGDTVAGRPVMVAKEIQ